MSRSASCRIHGDRWNGFLNHEWHAENPSAFEYEGALLRLDAKKYTMITIARDDGKHLTIGGGAGQYVVCATFDNEVFWNLVRPEPTSGVVLLNAGGQDGDFPAGQVVGLEQAHAAGLVLLKFRPTRPNSAVGKAVTPKP